MNPVNRRRWALAGLALAVIGAGTALQPPPEVGDRKCREPLRATEVSRPDEATGRPTRVGVCVLDAGGEEILVSRYGKWPRRGAILTLPAARRRSASTCLEGLGRRYAVVGVSTSRERVRGSNASERMLGLEGPDDIAGRLGNDCMDGGPGDDVLNGGADDDILIGGSGNDDIRGGGGGDDIDGGLGNDVMEGGPGADRVVGGPGNDTIRSGGGRDVIEAGGGDDVIGAVQSALLSVDCGAGRDRVRVLRENRNRARNCEVVELGGG